MDGGVFAAVLLVRAGAGLSVAGDARKDEAMTDEWDEIAYLLDMNRAPRWAKDELFDALLEKAAKLEEKRHE